MLHTTVLTAYNKPICLFKPGRGNHVHKSSTTDIRSGRTCDKATDKCRQDLTFILAFFYYYTVTKFLRLTPLAYQTMQIWPYTLICIVWWRELLWLICHIFWSSSFTWHRLCESFEISLFSSFPFIYLFIFYLSIHEPFSFTLLALNVTFLFLS